MACENDRGEPCELFDDNCSPFDLTDNNDYCFIDSVVEEALDIAGAQMNVYKLLGVHEQQRLIDTTGNGSPISSGELAAYPAMNAFLDNGSHWRTTQKGSNVITTGFIGYDFGEIKLENNRDRYGIDTSIRKHITTIIVKQGSQVQNRITKARVERSEDGQTWKGVAIIELEDTANEIQISFKRSAAERYWRIRPLEFNGGAADPWIVERLQLIHYNETSLENYEEDDIFLEMRNRDYAEDPIQLKAFYDLIDIQTELSRFGLELPNQQLYLMFNFSSCVKLLGRPIIIGDIIELPSETQYDPNMNPIKKYMEVTDTAWSTEGYSPGWTPTLVRVIVQPAYAQQETQDIFNDFVPRIDETTGFLDIDRSKYTDLSEVSDRVESAAKNNLPERGQDTADIAEIETPGYERLNIQNELYIRDAMPPNGEAFTEGDDFPTSPANGAYHRLTYSSVTNDTIPPRLYRWSISKNRWIYLETDERFKYNETKPTLQKFLRSGKSLSDINK